MRRLIPLAIAAVLLVGCKDAFTPSGVSGTYNLRTVNGEALPYSETEFGTTFTYTAGSIVLRADGTYTMSASVSWSDGEDSGTMTLTTSGTFTLTEPNTITMTDSDGDSSAATLDGGRITVTGDGYTYVFEK